MESKKTRYDFTEFFLGLVLFCIGLFMFSKKVIVYTTWGVFNIGGFDVTSGLVTVPLIIGMIWLFFNPRSSMPKILIVLGLIIIVVSIIMSLKITFTATTLYEYIIIIGFFAAGLGLLLRAFFVKK